MSIRQATEGDFQAIAELTAAAFMDEELYGGLKHPRRKDYPDDFITYFYFKIGKHYYDPSRQVLVAVENGSGTVVGMADWERQGQTSNTQKNFHKRAAGFDNRAADHSKLNILEESFNLVSYYWDGERQENWSLDLLAVHPAFEGKGYGRLLVQWGIDEARKEGIATSVVAAHEKDKFYEKLGFCKVGMANVGPLAENGMKGGSIMFIDKI